MEKKKKKSQLREWVDSALVALVLVVFIRTFFFQIYKIPSGSMIPTLMPGDRIFVSRLVYGPKVPFCNLRLPGFRRPKRGDIIIFIPPHERHKHYIKRLIGLPGDTVSIRRGNIYINGKIVTIPQIARNFYYNEGKYGRKGEVVKIPPHKYFALGDNSINSQDSRFWGFVDENDITGKAEFIWWPIKRIGMIE